jgi:hypothetical protein
MLYLNMRQKDIHDFRNTEFWRKSRRLTAVLLMATTASSGESSGISDPVKQMHEHCVSVLIQIFNALYQADVQLRELQFRKAARLLDALLRAVENGNLDKLVDSGDISAITIDIRELSSLLNNAIIDTTLTNRRYVDA